MSFIYRETGVQSVPRGGTTTAFNQRQESKVKTICTVYVTNKYFSLLGGAGGAYLTQVVKYTF